MVIYAKDAGAFPVIPLHSTPKLFVGVPQSPVKQISFPLTHWQSVLAQNLAATVLAGIEKEYSAPGFISQPVVGGSGTPNAPTHKV